jgi:protein required for attachment to host cells
VTVKKAKNGQNDESTWIVIINQSKAKVFAKTDSSWSLEHLKTIDNPIVDTATKEFLREVAEFLDHERRKERVKHLLISAEPRVLGLLKTKMEAKTSAIVLKWISKDLEKKPTRTISETMQTSSVGARRH